MKAEKGFTLFELMIVVTIIAILSAIALPAYQRYVQKAALVDVLQTIMIYRTDIELCYLQQGHLTACNGGDFGISTHHTSRYIKQLQVKQGMINIVNQGILTGLTLVITPMITNLGNLQWQYQCQSDAEKNELITLCETLFLPTSFN